MKFLNRRFASGLLLLCFALAPHPAYAGMPSFALSDIATMRFEALSFFLLLFFLISWVVYRLWNYLQVDFSTLPRLTYRKALALVFLWGLAFQLVLVMISGARELLTPGAWKKVGATYQLESGAATNAKTTAVEKVELEKTE